jgi:hypothetical protein
MSLLTSSALGWPTLVSPASLDAIDALRFE